MPAKIPLDDHELAALREAGWTVPQLAKEFRVCPRTIYNRLHAADHEFVNPTTSVCPSKETLEALYLVRGLSVAKIATQFRVNPRTAQRWLTKHGIRRTPIPQESKP